MADFSSLDPASVWRHFVALSAIPRISGEEAAAGMYVEQVASSNGWSFRRDVTGNVLVTKPATPGMANRAGIVLQGHLDMVGQKTSDSTHNFLKDPLRLMHDGVWVRAEKTTLGADNGIGVALALALLEDSSLQHGPLSALFTVDEEVGLKGAANVKADFLPGDWLINIDGDREDEIIIGCAGSATVKVEMELPKQLVEPGAIGMKVSVGGLKGGHSGADIHLGRGNANILLARLLASAGGDAGVRISSWEGGDARNAIPRTASARVTIEARSDGAFRSVLSKASAEIRNELGSADPGFSVRIDAITPDSEALTSDDSQKVIEVLRSIPNGALRFSPEQNGVVETSNNLAIVKIDARGGFQVQCLARSLIDSAAQNVVGMIGCVAQLAGAACLVEGAYPGWQPVARSPLATMFGEVCERHLGRPGRLIVVHGGLECGLLRATRPELECVAVGPRIDGMHSPDECLEIASVGRVFRILKEVIGRAPIVD